MSETSDLLPSSYKGLNYQKVSKDLCIPMDTHRLKRPNLLWLNSSWLALKGFDLNDPSKISLFENYLVGTFGVCVKTSTLPEGSVTDEMVTLYADRYGETAGGLHGGSGRLGSRGLFQAKGVGRTPLVSSEASLSYTHGYLWLQEAIRETITNEWANSWLPFGTIPIVAIIDTGMEVQLEGYPTTERAAIVVRPNFLRPAHFERAYWFGGAGTASSDQYRDGERVKTLVQAYGRPGQDDGIDFQDIRTMFLRFASQVGACRARRVWSGNFLTSNLSIDGALVDFGGFISVPNWCRIDDKVGTEEEHLLDSARSLIFSFDKHIPSHRGKFDAYQIAQDMKEEIADSFVRTTLQSLGEIELDRPYKKRFGSALLSYYAAQQNIRLSLSHSFTRAWIGDLLDGNESMAPNQSSKERECARELHAVLAEAATRSGAGFPEIARRFFSPWKTVYMGSPLTELTDLRWSASYKEPNEARAFVSRYIDSKLDALKQVRELA